MRPRGALDLDLDVDVDVDHVANGGCSVRTNER
jgi:hypothetical protein